MAKQTQVVENAGTKGGVITVRDDGYLANLGLMEIRARPGTEKQPHFVIANITVITDHGIALRGFRLLKSKRNEGSYLENQGIVRRDEKGDRISDFQQVELPPAIRSYVERTAASIMGMGVQ